MAHVRRSVHYDAPIEEVFRFATDFARYPEWNVSYPEVRDITGPTDAVGTRFHVLMRLLGRQLEGWSEIVEIDSPRYIKLVGRATEGPPSTAIYRLTPAAGGTDLEFEFDYELPSGILGQFADRLFVERAVERDLNHSIENARAFIESRQPVLA